MQAEHTWREADTKKNCCFRRSSFPYSVASLGYSTALMSSAFRLCSTACDARPGNDYQACRMVCSIKQFCSVCTIKRGSTISAI